MRFSIVETIYEAAKKDPAIFFITGDLGHAKTKEFQTELKSQYLNAGMSEQNIIGMAAGLALSGMKVFVYSIVPFITLRCYEQIKNDICLQSADVTVVGIGGGYAYGNVGSTHHSIEDVAIMRALPNMKVICPATPYETKELTAEIIRSGGPAYIRVGRGKEANLEKEYRVSVGKAEVIHDGSDITLIATGPILLEAIKAATILQEKNINTEVINTHTIKPLDEEIIHDRAKNRKAIFTLEEHSIIGGLGSAVAEVLSETEGPKPIFKRLGIRDKWASMYGSQEYLREQAGISGAKVAEKVLEIIQNI